MELILWILKPLRRAREREPDTSCEDLFINSKSQRGNAESENEGKLDIVRRYRMYVRLFKVGQRQQLSGNTPHLLLLLWKIR